MVAHHPEAPPADSGEDVVDAPASPEPSTTTPASTSRDSQPTPTPEEPEATYPVCGPTCIPVTVLNWGENCTSITGVASFPLTKQCRPWPKMTNAWGQLERMATWTWGMMQLSVTQPSRLALALDDVKFTQQSFRSAT